MILNVYMPRNIHTYNRVAKNDLKSQEAKLIELKGKKITISVEDFIILLLVSDKIIRQKRISKDIGDLSPTKQQGGNYSHKINIDIFK